VEEIFTLGLSAFSGPDVHALADLRLKLASFLRIACRSRVQQNEATGSDGD
jgi:hypothetical protein